MIISESTLFCNWAQRRGLNLSLTGTLGCAFMVLAAHPSLTGQAHAGNNAVEMQTTATFDARTDEFIVHSPTVLSQKYWITNGAIHAKWAVVFCQLLIGGTNQGVHGLLVRIREEVRGWHACRRCGLCTRGLVLSQAAAWLSAAPEGWRAARAGHDARYGRNGGGHGPQDGPKR